ISLRRIFEDRACIGIAVRLGGVALLLRLSQLCRYPFWNTALQGECHFCHNESRWQGGASIGEPYCRAGELLVPAIGMHAGNSCDHVAEFSPESACIHEKSAADTAGNALGKLYSAVAFGRRFAHKPP